MLTEVIFSSTIIIHTNMDKIIFMFEIFFADFFLSMLVNKFPKLIDMDTKKS